MKVILLFSALIAVVIGQNDSEAAINRVFNNGRNNNLNWEERYEEVTKKPPETLGALEKCGQGSDEGVHLCVPYYNCDANTNTIIDVGTRSSVGQIDIRAGANACDKLLEVCCSIPDGKPISSSERPREPEIITSEDPIPLPITTTSTTQRPTQRPTDPPRRVPSQCGIRNTNGIDFQITGNFDNEAEYGEFPWMLAILKTNYDPATDKTLAICGGSLITPNVVLTGAHCVYKYKTHEIKVRAGEWDTQTEQERLPYQERRVVNIITHNNFNQNSLFNDFALLILESPFQEAEHIRTICLPQQNQIINSKECFATGWGKNVFGQEGKYSVILKKIQVPTVPFDQCQNSLRNTRLGSLFKLDKSFMCAGGEQGKDTCTGDGGSPLVCPDPNNPARYVQAGIVAWGIGCGEQNIPAVYADVAKFRQWIDDNLRQLNIDTSPYIN